jgi:hypothetical protein
MPENSTSGRSPSALRTIPAPGQTQLRVPANATGKSSQGNRRHGHDPAFPHIPRASMPSTTAGSAAPSEVAKLRGQSRTKAYRITNRSTSYKSEKETALLKDPLADISRSIDSIGYDPFCSERTSTAKLITTPARVSPELFSTGVRIVCRLMTYRRDTSRGCRTQYGISFGICAITTAPIGIAFILATSIS